MILKFKIEYAQESKPTAIIARQLQQHDFYVGGASTLGGCKLQKHLSQPRALRSYGTPDLDLFVFYLANGNDRDEFKVGAEVEFVS